MYNTEQNNEGKTLQTSGYVQYKKLSQLFAKYCHESILYIWNVLKNFI